VAAEAFATRFDGIYQSSGQTLRSDAISRTIALPVHICPAAG
jgi:hypothetical protein